MQSIRAHGAILVMFVAIGALVGCSDPPSTGTLTLQLTDAPFPRDMLVEAELGVDGVEVHVTAADDGDSGFHVVSDTLSAVNLLDLSNGITEFLGRAELPVGEIKQMRLLVSSAAVKLVDDRRFDLDVPSGESSGLKVRFDPPLEIVADEETNVIFDVDISSSFSAQPVGPTRVDEITGFRFHPVLRVAVSSETGSLAGRVTAIAGESPVEGATVSVRDGDTVLTSTFTDADGDWMVLGVPPGSWIVRAEAAGFTPVQTTADAVAGATVTVEGLALN
jgi:hypothetical protein